MSKFTPGPWHIQRYRNRHNIHIETTGFIGTKIARIEQREEQLANAQAIAQVPRMAEVLKCALADLWGWAMDNDLELMDNSPTCQSIREIIQVLTDAGVDVSDYDIGK